MLSEEENKAIDKLKGRKKIGIYELIRTFKREGIENFVTTRKEYIETILNLIEKQNKIIDKMAEDIILLREAGWLTNINNKQDAIEYYTKLAEEEK